MYCSVCDRDSKNRRVCPYCFTPYPEEGASAKRPSMRQTSQSASNAPAKVGFLGSVRNVIMAQSPVVRWAGAGIIVALLVWNLSGSGDSDAEPSSIPSDIVATPSEYQEAVETIRTTRETALVDIQQDEVFVSYPAASFPIERAEQRALMERFARADEIIEGRKRRIFFYNPNGKLFAQSDGLRGALMAP